MADHHKSLSPSALPMLAACQCFERAEAVAPQADEYRETGHRLHTAFANRLLGKPDGVELTLQQRDDVDWAVDIVRGGITLGAKVEIEQKISLCDDSFNLITFGTPDVMNGATIWDLKSLAAHDYYWQMLCYAVMKMERDGDREIDVYLLYSMGRKVQKMSFHHRAAKEALFGLFDRINSRLKLPVANAFCKWCAKATTCPAVTDKVLGTGLAISKLKDKPDKSWSLESFDPEKLTDPDEMAKALTLTKTLSDWIKAIENQAKEQAKAGSPPTGWVLNTVPGNREITDAVKAFRLSGLTAEEFHDIMSVGVGALEQAIAKKEGITVKAAKELVNIRLCSVLQRKKDMQKLERVSTKKDKD